jgi:hypothetical protein
MRLWSLHPSYLDPKGLTALWREALLAKKVMKNLSSGYKHHPQLIRFRKSTEPLQAINYYLSVIFDESCARGYHFDAGKFTKPKNVIPMSVSHGQMVFEVCHLKNKLKIRNPGKYNELMTVGEFIPHTLFYIIEGKTEEWEKFRQP